MSIKLLDIYQHKVTGHLYKVEDIHENHVRLTSINAPYRIVGVAISRIELDNHFKLIDTQHDKAPKTKPLEGPEEPQNAKDTQ